MRTGLFRLLVLAAVGAAGCGGITITIDPDFVPTFDPDSVFSIDPGFVPFPVMTLVLVNETEFPVNPSVFVSDIDHFIIEGLTESLLTVSENEQRFGEIFAGEVLEFEYDCDDFKAVKAEDAELLAGFGIEPEDSTGLLVDDEDFDCGDTVVITYSGGVLGFDARISVERSGF